LRLCIHSASFTAAPGVLKLPAVLLALAARLERLEATLVEAVRAVVVEEGGLAVDEAGLAVAGLETLDLCRCRAARDE